MSICGHNACYSLLSVSDMCARTYVDLYLENDGSGRQVWMVRPSSRPLEPSAADLHALHKQSSTCKSLALLSLT